MERLEHTWTALVTPFTAEMDLDWSGYDKLVAFQMEQGISGLLPVGTTGESPTLSWDEHNGLIDRVIRTAHGKRPVLAGTGSNATHEAITHSLRAAHEGADAVLMVDCYYNGPSSAELRDHYYAAVAARIPDTLVVPYVIPGRTGTALEVADLALLAARHPNITTVKEATGDLERMRQTRALCGEAFSIMSGDDDRTFAMMADPQIRANGVISVMSNIAPAAISRMVTLLAAGQLDEASQVRDALAPLFSIVTVKTPNVRTLPDGSQITVEDRYRNPLPVKTLMAGLGMPAGGCREPLGRMSAAGVNTVRQAAAQVWQHAPWVLEPIEAHFGVCIAERLADDSAWNALAAQEG